MSTLQIPNMRQSLQLVGENAIALAVYKKVGMKWAVAYGQGYKYLEMLIEVAVLAVSSYFGGIVTSAILTALRI